MGEFDSTTIRNAVLLTGVAGIALGCAPTSSEVSYADAELGEIGYSGISVEELIDMSESFSAMSGRTGLGEDLSANGIDSKYVLQIVAGGKTFPIEIYYSSKDETADQSMSAAKEILSFVLDFLRSGDSGNISLRPRASKILVARSWNVTNKARTWETDSNAISFVFFTDQRLFEDIFTVESCQAFAGIPSFTKKETYREYALDQEYLCNSVGAMVYAARMGVPYQRDVDNPRGYVDFVQNLRDLTKNKSLQLSVPDPLDQNLSVPVEFITFDQGLYDQVLELFRDNRYERPSAPKTEQSPVEIFSREIVINHLGRFIKDPHERHLVLEYLREATFPFLSSKPESIIHNVRALFQVGFELWRWRIAY